MQETNEARGLTEPTDTQMEETETATAGMCLDDPKDMPTVEMTTTNSKLVITHENPLVEAVLRKAYENGIPVEVVKDVEDVVNEFSKKTKIELIMAKREIENYNGLKELAAGLAESSKSMSATSKVLTDFIEPNFDFDKNENEADAAESIEEPETETAPEDELANEIDDMYKSLENDIAIANIAYDVVYQKYMEDHPNTTVYDDLLEKLLKDKATLESGNNINAPKLIACIDDVITCMQKNDLEALLVPFHTKTDNQKRLRILAKELINVKRPVYRDLETIGITQEHIVKFINFFITEANFRETYAMGPIGFPDARLIPNICLFFLYHLCKIITNSRKRATYETLKYRLAFMHVIDVVDKYPSNTKTFTENRFIGDATDENAEPTELSIARAKVYDTFVPLLMKYFGAMNDQTLVKYSAAQARKTR